MSTQCNLMQQHRYPRANINTLKRALTILLALCSAMSNAPSYAKHLMIYGDSLSAAYGIDLEQGWANLLSSELGAEHRISNASISGETSGGGLARLTATITEIKPDIVFLELGANDGLRGYPVTTIKRNLQEMIALLKGQDIEIVLAGISLPPSYGPRYIDQFRAMYQDLAAESDLPFIDMYNEEFLVKDGFIQQDGLHPTALAQPAIAAAILKFFKQQELFELNQ